MGLEVLAVTALAGTAMSAAGQISAGKSARRAAEHNARIAERQAVETLEQSREEENIFRIQASKRIGATKAARGASGLRAEGSVIDIIAESTMNAEADALNIRLAGEREAQALRDGASLQRQRGAAASAAASMGAAGTLLQGGANFMTSFGGAPAPEGQ